MAARWLRDCYMMIESLAHHRDRGECRGEQRVQRRTHVVARGDARHRIDQSLARRLACGPQIPQLDGAVECGVAEANNAKEGSFDAISFKRCCKRSC